MEKEDIEIMYEGGAKGTDKEFRIEQEVHANSIMAADKGEITYHMVYEKKSEELSNGGKFRDERPIRIPLRYFEFSGPSLYHLAPAKLFIRHAFKRLAVNAAGVLPQTFLLAITKEVQALHLVSFGRMTVAVNPLCFFALPVEYFCTCSDTPKLP